MLLYQYRQAQSRIVFLSRILEISDRWLFAECSFGLDMLQVWNCQYCASQWLVTPFCAGQGHQWPVC